MNKNSLYVFLSTNQLSKEGEICNTAYGFAISGKDGIGMGHHLYIISDDEIKEGDWVLEDNKQYPDKVVQVKTKGDYGMRAKKIIATTNRELEIKVRDNSNNGDGATLDYIGHTIYKLPNISQSDIEYIISLHNKKDKGVDVANEKLANEFSIVRVNAMKGKWDSHIVMHESFNGFCVGYEQCLSDNADKKFDLEDMRKIMNIGMSLRQDQLNGYAGKSGEEHLQEYARCLDQEQPKKDTIMVEYENELCNDVLDEGTNYKEFVEQRLKVKDGCIVIVR